MEKPSEKLKRMGWIEQFLVESYQPLEEAVKSPVRLAYYPANSTVPKIEDVFSPSLTELMDLVASRAFRYLQEEASLIPFTALKEVVENLVHASFRDAVISIMDFGQVVRVADRGPGITDKERALLPGFTTASAEMRKYIRGVGCGLPLAQELVSTLGGKLLLENNLERGTVVTIYVPAQRSQGQITAPLKGDGPSLSPRQQKILFLLAEISEAGPSQIASELNFSISTVYRELRTLETLGIVKATEEGKRYLTEFGLKLLSTRGEF